MLVLGETGRQPEYGLSQTMLALLSLMYKWLCFMCS
jgi:hypothetical protein